MAWEDRLPRDWRVALAVAALTVLAGVGLKAWVVSIARAEDAPQREAVEKILPKVEALYLACVKRGECAVPNP